ncbi:MAG: hypothetical protein ABIR77_03040 [Sphingomicrobium sp.]
MASGPPRSTKDEGGLPWLDGVSPAVGRALPPANSSVFRWVAVLALVLLIALAGFLVGRRSDAPALPPAPRLTIPSVAASPLAPVGAATPADSPRAAALERQTAPALARVEAQSSASRPAATPTATATAPALRLRPEQLRAVRQIVRAGRVDIHSSATPRVATQQAFSPSVGDSGRVVQLGAYRSVAEAESAAKAFRYKYRGLLEALPKAVLPFRPTHSSRIFYRVQFVTPSQAYAEVTCQRLRAAAKTCIVLY